MEKYDVVIIGAGPSGYAAAMRAVDFKKKTLLIEKNTLGGAGITNGALSSKTWWELSRDMLAFRKNLARYNMTAPATIWKEIQLEVNQAVKERIDLLQDHLNQLKHSSQYNTYLDYQTGTAEIIDEHTIRISTENINTDVEADYIIIASGSRPRILPNIPIDEKHILTSDTIENMDDFPKSMVIVGAGVIGCEYATIFAGFGQTKVYLIDKGDTILPFEDQDVVAVIEKTLEEQGVHIHRNSTLVNMEIKDGQVVYQLEFSDGHTETFEVEKALISVGRVPNYENIWSDAVPIKMNRRGIEDTDTNTSVKNIYAIGDITADINLVNVGELEGRYAIEKIFGKPCRQLVYENISTIMFLNPEVAGVGLNEKMAKEQGLNYKAVTVDYTTIPRAIAKRDTQGFIKLLVTDDDEMKVLGMRVVGEQASSAIQAVALLISMDKGIEELAECVHPHPSITEGIQESVRALLGKSILKSGLLKNKVNCYCYNCEKEELRAF
ncbi:NAD(P)/FAD-dependent oxidoreductase [Marivirga sp. S37H4]|uniref:NAD(P)/FAD-dependent oxidoreductase n=1 Tax=Marivirga aurantiaca TaxID=2802615 RepID=A0A934WWC0_9BACT|nr:NAD(P)/FAD-dependent oxidoreductase [Marivirga aurantiaca]MBK6264184.1 NAD(P)/FAD-dependent oxidoreductase [Marivirga aurantiaca]